MRAKKQKGTAEREQREETRIDEPEKYFVMAATEAEVAYAKLVDLHAYLSFLLIL